MTRPEIVVVNIFSVSYSGSTWLNLMLGAHGQGLSVGEAKRMLRTPRPICSLHPEFCPFFSQIDLAARENLFLQIARRAGRRFLIVNNSRKLLGCQEHPSIERRFIHLVRDGRPTTASYLRKNPGQNMWRAARWWVHDVKRNQRLMNRQQGRPMVVRYEDLRADTSGQLRRVCDHIGMDYHPAMLEYWKVDHHYIGGNLGTLLSLKRQQKQELPEDWEQRLAYKQLEWDLGFYMRSDPAHFRDDRWLTELTPWQRRVFGWVAGATNRRYGYPRA